MSLYAPYRKRNEEGGAGRWHAATEVFLGRKLKKGRGSLTQPQVAIFRQKVTLLASNVYVTVKSTLYRVYYTCGIYEINLKYHT